MALLEFDPKTTALVLIDLQHGIVGRTLAPHSASDVVSRAATLAAAMRAKGGTVVYVRVDIAEVLHLPADFSMRGPNDPPPPPIASELVPESGFEPGDVFITKRQWGAFYDTGLDQQLRRRGIKTVMMGGIATNIGVESTARAAFDRGYALIFVEDVMSTMSVEAHEGSTKGIFRMMGRVRTLDDVLQVLG